MQLRIRLKRGPGMRANTSVDRRVALALGALLTPAALMAFALAFWRFGADMQWTGRFAIDEGLFSHWQVWTAMGITLEICAIALNRYGRGGDASAG